MRSLDQHWLVDEEYARESMGLAGIDSGDTVLEIGPGAGALTTHIAERARRVVAIEIDRRLQGSLSRLAARFGNIDIIWGDALDVPFPRVHKVVGNPPFSITEPLLEKLTRHSFESATLIVGERFGRAATASHGDARFGKLTILANAFY
jgi:16S rRNA (adenine1518-N6/adenine1519-N6)-dimethyltransferase